MLLIERKLKMLRFSLFYVYVFCTCFGAREPPTITIPDQGIIMGKELSKSRIQKIIAYYGIPYAQPPLDKLRFSPPMTDPLPRWEGVRNATEYAPACLQTKEDYRKEALPFLQLISDLNFEMSEDCLYLNVFVPYGNPPPNGFATIIWFHPGNFTTGSPSMWNPHTLVYRHRIILVTMAWRLSIMGFFTTMDGEAPGNYALLDQQAAMFWIKKNIKLFGGNPDNICAMGYGTGGISIGIHMVNTESRNLFNKAIIMSANFLNPFAVKYPQEDKDLLDRLAESFFCIRNPTSKLIDCLRHVEAELLVQETSNINWRPLLDSGLSNTTPPFIAELPKLTFERGDFSKIPLLTGYTDMEEMLGISELDNDLSSNVTNELLEQILMDMINNEIPVNNNTDSCYYNYEHIFDSVMFFYGASTKIKNVDELRRIIADFTTEKNFAASTYLHATYVSNEQPTYVYRFDVKPITEWAVDNIPKWVSVPHLFDLIYVWGVPYWSELHSNTWELRDKSISDIIMSFWTNFAKTSDPTEGSLYPIRWDTFTNNNPGILIIDGRFNMSNTKNINYKAFEFWNDYYPKVFEIGTKCCKMTDSTISLVPVPCILLLINYFIINRF